MKAGKRHDATSAGILLPQTRAILGNDIVDDTTSTPLTPPPFQATLNEDMQRKMIQPLPEALGGFAQDRFKRFAKAILAVPKSEAIAPEEALAKLEIEKQEIDAKLADVRRILAKRKPVRQKPSHSGKD